MEAKAMIWWLLLGLAIGLVVGFLFCVYLVNGAFDGIQRWWIRLWCRHELVYGRGMNAYCKKCDYWEH
jgi:hypothetical protein